MFVGRHRAPSSTSMVRVGWSGRGDSNPLVAHLAGRSTVIGIRNHLRMFAHPTIMDPLDHELPHAIKPDAHFDLLSHRHVGHADYESEQVANMRGSPRTAHSVDRRDGQALIRDLE